MATVTVSTADPRSVKALALLPQARTWATGRRKCDGRRFLVAPASRMGAVYYVDANGAECTCPDRQVRRVTCKHMTTARLLLVERGAGADEPVVLTADEDARLDLAFAALSLLAGPVVRSTRYDALFPVEA